MTSAGLPHSGIRGLAPADGSPRLIAAFHALHRLLTPRHPPCALNSSAPRSRTTLSRQDRLTIHYSSLVKERSLPGLSLNVDHRRRPTKGHEHRMHRQQKRSDSRRTARPPASPSRLSRWLPYSLRADRRRNDDAPLKVRVPAVAAHTLP